MIEDHREFNKQHYLQLDPEMRLQAAKAFRAMLELENTSAIEELRERITESPDWLMGREGEWPLHHGWGTSVRNWFRQHGYGEQELGIENLDDFYSALVESAIMGEGYVLDYEPA